ncbi:PREDICTED: probable aspartic protease At2g35615 [Ipomoea nil]|uniref:probable aspartic protease At2g35615 n=1 Tax=Ipomoea nil TaxID=35883 RepID=UPI000900BBAA|nr:PREDICTED: probable aspartic protease At2g35615 [Ipomoea nil]
MASKIFSVFAVFYLFSAQSNGFTVDLIHRDSPLSPFFNPSNSRFDSLRESFRRSQARAAYFKKRAALGSAKFVVDIEVIPGEYIMKFSIGTPPVETFAIADTGSDLTWTQCLPCVRCFDQDFPLFEPQKSSSYRSLPCNSPLCSEFFCAAAGNVCQYQYSYADESKTVGVIANETLLLGNASFPNVAFGCGHQNGGTFTDAASGIVGLGGGPVSIITQLSKHIAGKFAYCLPPPQPSNISTHIKFGPDAAMAPDTAVVSTPLTPKAPATFYWLTLENISVGNKTLRNNQSSETLGREMGNIIIDSGTTMTYIPPDLYDLLESELKRQIKKTPVNDPEGVFKLCFQTSGGLELPSIVAHFTGADIELSPKGIFIFVDESVVCLTLFPATEIDPIFGNLSQVDYIVAYDLVGNTVSFKPADCSKY